MNIITRMINSKFYIKCSTINNNLLITVSYKFQGPKKP